jgi:glycosyltransferase involved in cell wall biosynthesis
MKIFFIIDNGSNHRDIVKEGSGASELLFYRTIFALSSFFDITIYNYGESTVLDGIQYIHFTFENLSFIKNITGSTVVIQRYFDKAIQLHKTNSTNHYIIWSHDYMEHSSSILRNEYTYEELNAYISNNYIDVVAVSQFHKKNLLSYMPTITVHTIYNALFPDLYTKHDNIPINKNHIVFASNWGKGLDRVIHIGREYYTINPEFRLRLIKPSYCNWTPDLSHYPFIELIGCIKDKNEYCRLMQSCLCVLTTSYPETFGCVFAEALHIGVPVIADKSVSAGYLEFVSPTHQCNFNHPSEVITLIEQFRVNVPEISLPDHLYCDEIMKDWRELLLFKR